LFKKYLFSFFLFSPKQQPLNISIVKLFLMKYKRTHTNGELDLKDKGKTVVLAGWNYTRRDHGGIIFIDLRDRYGLTQAVFDPKHSKNVHATAEKLKTEDVILIKGKVRPRGKGLENPKLKTGKIEVLVDDIEILNRSETPPIEVEDRVVANDDLRLKYRFLDLRRPVMQKNFLIRHETAQAAREFLNKNNFLEIETPMLVRATPEGARDYIVPSRISPGKFYALPQSPQLYKQILMVAGFDRYYQLARCLRDEDLRQDRQPEHTQIDLEMSFVDEDDVMDMVEGMVKHVLKKVIKKDIKQKFPRIKYDDAMSKYGTDKPDLRFGMEIMDITDIAKKSDFEVFKKAEKVKCVNAEKNISRKEIDDLIDFAQKIGSKGLAWMRVTANGLESSIVKFFNKNIQKKIFEKTKAKKGVLFFIADNEKNATEIIGNIRIELGKRLNLTKNDEFKFCWVTDYPLFDWDDDNAKWMPAHHMFSSPKEECITYLEKEPAKVRAKLYDLVLNGVELCSGSIRIVNKELQERVMKVIGLSKEEAENKFGFLLNAFRYGAPPHGGVGFGFDRFVSLMCGFNDIREVITFPKNKNAECPMDNSPSDIPEDHLKELHVKVDVMKKKTN